MIYKHTVISMSKTQLSSALYWCIMLDAVITAAHALPSTKQFTRQQNSRNSAWLVIGFKNEESAQQFAEKTGFPLTNPPRPHLNKSKHFALLTITRG